MRSDWVCPWPTGGHDDGITVERGERRANVLSEGGAQEGHWCSMEAECEKGTRAPVPQEEEQVRSIAVDYRLILMRSLRLRHAPVSFLCRC